MTTTSDAESLKMLQFLAVKVKTAGFEYDASAVWQEFKETTGSTETVDELERRFREELIKELYKAKEFKIKAKAQILFATKTIVDSVFLHRLQKDGKTEIDGTGRIISWTARRNSADLLSTSVNKRGRKRRTMRSTSQNEDRKRHRHEQIQSDSEEGQYEEEGIDEPIVLPDYQQRNPEQFNQRVKMEDVNESAIWHGAEKAQKLVQYRLQHETKLDWSIKNSLRSLQVPESVYQERVPEQIERGNSSSSLEEANHNEMISGKELLQNIKMVLLALENPELNGLLGQVRSSIEKLEAVDKMVPSNDIKKALDMILLMIPKSSNQLMDIKPFGSLLSLPGTSSAVATSEASVKHFLELLRFVATNMNSSALNEITAKISEKLGVLLNVEEKIPINTIRVGLETMLLVIINS